MASATTSGLTSPWRRERRQHRDHDVAGVGLEVAAQLLAGVAAAEPVGTERQVAADATQRAIWSGTAFM